MQGLSFSGLGSLTQIKEHIIKIKYLFAESFSPEYCLIYFYIKIKRICNCVWLTVTAVAVQRDMFLRLNA